MQQYKIKIGNGTTNEFDNNTLFPSSGSRIHVENTKNRICRIEILLTYLSSSLVRRLSPLLSMMESVLRRRKIFIKLKLNDKDNMPMKIRLQV